MPTTPIPGRYSISNRISGHVLGVYEGDTEEQALDALAQDAGYRDYADQARQLGRTVEELRDELVLDEVPRPRHLPDSGHGGYSVHTALPVGLTYPSVAAAREGIEDDACSYGYYAHLFQAEVVLAVLAERRQWGVAVVTYPGAPEDHARKEAERRLATDVTLGRILRVVSLTHVGTWAR